MSAGSKEQLPSSRPASLPSTTWAWSTPARIVSSGPVRKSQLSSLCESLEVERIFVVANHRTGRTFIDAVLADALPDVVVTRARTQVRQHAPIESIRMLLAEAQEFVPDAVLACGGGSTIDAARAIITLLSGRPLDLNPRAEKTPLGAVDLLPLITVPTTLAGAEFASVGAYTDSGIKRFFGWPGLTARASIYDPRAIRDLPPDILISTGMNGLAHAIEATYGPRRSPIADGLAKEGARLLTAGLLSFTHGDGSELVFQSLQNGAILSGMALAHAGAAIHHSVGHVLGGRFELAHGTASAVMLPYTVAFNEKLTVEAQSSIFRCVADELDAAGIAHGPTLAEALGALQAALGMPASLSEVGLTSDQLAVLRNEILEHEPGLELNPRAIDKDSLDRLLNAAFSGDIGSLR